MKVLISHLKMQPYASIICYPKLTETEIEYRYEELRAHGVEAVEFSGKTTVLNLPILGKGYVGIVIIAYLNSKKIALKIRRVDADRLSLKTEAQMLSKANSVQVGPRLLGVSKNFLLSQLIEGDLLPDWLSTLEKSTYIRGSVQAVLSSILEQCWQLDNIGLDHGELSKAPKHLIVDKELKPWIVDFETASLNRKPANVTSVCQFLFLSGGGIAKLVAATYKKINREKLLAALRCYKIERSRKNFEKILDVCF